MPLERVFHSDFTMSTPTSCFYQTLVLLFFFSFFPGLVHDCKDFLPSVASLVEKCLFCLLCGHMHCKVSEA